jgi:hypothetical protein
MKEKRKEMTDEKYEELIDSISYYIKPKKEK